MAIIPDPIFFRKLKRGSGGKRKIINFANTEGESVKLTVSDVEKPEWLELEVLRGIHHLPLRALLNGSELRHVGLAIEERV